MRKNNFKIVLALGILSAAAFTLGTLAACGKKTTTTPPPSDQSFLNITAETVTLGKYEEKAIGYETNLDNLVWSVADESIVTVTQDGILTAWKVGQTTLTLSQGEYSDSCSVVVEKGVIVPSVILEDTEIGLIIGDSYTLSPTLICNGKTYEDAAYCYESSATSVATVDENGRITAISGGTAEIFVVGSWRGEDEALLTERVTVNVHKNIGLSIDEKSFSLFAAAEFAGESFTTTTTAHYTLTKDGKAYSGGQVEWQTEDESIVTVSDAGVLNAQKAGKTRIRAVFTENEDVVSSLWIPVTVAHSVVPFGGEYTVDVWDKEISDELVSLMEGKSFHTAFVKETGERVYEDGALTDSLKTGKQKWVVAGDKTGYEIDVIVASKVITTTEEFLYMHQYILTNVGGKYDGYLVLGNDIDFTGFKGYKTGYGTGISTTIYDPYFSDGNGSLGWYILEGCTGFNGTFDGRGYKVIGGKFANYGMFHKLTSAAVVENVAFIDCDFASSNEATTVTRENSGTIRNVFVTVASPCTKKTSAGITIKNKGTIENCVVYYPSAASIEEGGAAAFTTTLAMKNVYTVTDDTAILGEKAYASAEELYGAWFGLGEIDTSGFDTRYWDLENYMIPVFKGYEGSFPLSKKLVLDVEYRLLYAGESVSVSVNVPTAEISIENIDDKYASYVTFENGVLAVKSNVESVMSESSFTFELIVTFDGLTATEVITVEKQKETIKLGSEIEIETKEDNEILISSLVPSSAVFTKIRIGDVEIKGYTRTGNKLTLPASSLTNVKKYGENVLQLVTADAIYEQPLFVISKLIKTEQEFLRSMDDYLRTDVVGRYEGYVALDADLDFSQYTSTWYPGSNDLGWSASIYNNDENVEKTISAIEKYEGFFATLDGRGHTVSAMKFAVGGLLYKIGETGVIKNISFIDCNLSTDGHYVTPIAKYNRGTIDNVFVTVTSFKNWGDNYAGLVHSNYGTIQNVMVYYMGYVAGTGAIAYVNSGTVENAYSVTNVKYHVNGISYETAEEFYTAWKKDGEVDTSGFDSRYWDFEDYLIPVFKGFKGIVGEDILINALTIVVDEVQLTEGESVNVRTNEEGAIFSIEGLSNTYYDYVTLENGVLTIKDGVVDVMDDHFFTFKIVATLEDKRDEVTITVLKELPTQTLNGEVEIQTKEDNVITIDAAIQNPEEIVGLRVNGTVVEGYLIEGRTLTLPTTALANVNNFGEGMIEFVTEQLIYVQPAFIVSKIIMTNDEFLNMYAYIQTNTVGKYDGYIVLGADLDFMQYTSSWYQGNEILGWAMSVYNYDTATTKTKDALDAYEGFVGTFDGRGHSVKGLRYALGGLFYKLGAGGVVKNVALLNCRYDVYTSKSEDYIATIAKDNYGTVENVYVTIGQIDGAKYRYSALVGHNWDTGTIKNCVTYVLPTNANSQLTDSFQIDAVAQWNFGSTTNVHTITETRFVKTKTGVTIYNTAAAFKSANVRQTYFAGVEYADVLFTKFLASVDGM